MEQNTKRRRSMRSSHTPSGRREVPSPHAGGSSRRQSSVSTERKPISLSVALAVTFAVASPRAGLRARRTARPASALLRRGSRPQTACARTGCRTCPTRAPAAGSRSRPAPGSTRSRLRSSPPYKHAPSCCPAAARLAAPLRARQDPDAPGLGVHAATRHIRLSRSDAQLPIQPGRLQLDRRSGRSRPRDPGDEQRAVAGIQTGSDRLQAVTDQKAGRPSAANTPVTRSIVLKAGLSPYQPAGPAIRPTPGPTRKRDPRRPR
jgi:hypothetical protein